MWSFWSRGKSDVPKHPDRFINEAERINIKNGLDATDGYGYAMIYYAFTEGGTPDKWDYYSSVNKSLPEIYEANRPPSV